MAISSGPKISQGLRVHPDIKGGSPNGRILNLNPHLLSPVRLSQLTTMNFNSGELDLGDPTIRALHEQMVARAAELQKPKDEQLCHEEEARRLIEQAEKEAVKEKLVKERAAREQAAEEQRRKLDTEKRLKAYQAAMKKLETPVEEEVEHLDGWAEAEAKQKFAEKGPLYAVEDSKECDNCRGKVSNSHSHCSELTGVDSAGGSLPVAD
jgi:hypothetical protein